MCRVFQIGITDAAGVAEISRWCKPPVHHATLIQAPAGAVEIARLPFRRPCRGSSHIVCVTGGLYHRLMSNVPSGQVAAFPALTLEMRRGSRRFEGEDFAKQIRALRHVARRQRPPSGGTSCSSIVIGSREWN